MTPVRIQLSRAKGWRMPPNTVKVDRSTQWGNPFTIAAYRESGRTGSKETAAQVCVEAYRAWLQGEHHWAHGGALPKRPDLRGLKGKNLACWCKPGETCHADVLLELANGPTSDDPTRAGHDSPR